MKLALAGQGEAEPGGPIEAGEIPVGAARRELLEETGLVVAGLQPCWATVAGSVSSLQITR